MASNVINKVPSRKAFSFKPGNLSVHLILLLVAALMLVPFYWMIATSLKVDEDIFKVPPDLIPNPLNWENYPKVFDLQPMANALLNSLKIAILVTVGTLFTCSLAAYAFAKIKFKFSGVLFGIFLATIMIPGQITLIPLYIVFSKIGWVDTQLPLIVPGILLNAYGIFLLKQFMETVPTDYVEAAKLDGANHLQIYWRIMLPFCLPALVTLGLFTFLGNWNNFIGPLIFLNSESQFTVPLIINSFRTVYYVQWGLLMAASCVAVLPVLVLYLVAQRFFIQGIALAGLKG
jgi:multiple sugar transport system permease protein